MTDIYGWLRSTENNRISDGSNLTQVAEIPRRENHINPLLFKIIAKYTIGNQSIQWQPYLALAT